MPPRATWWQEYLGKFNDPVIRILMLAAGLAIAVGLADGHIVEGVGILVAIVLATFLAYWNEHRAAREFDVLNRSEDAVPAKVIRDGGYTRVPKRDVVVGDIVFVEVGEEVPADGTLLEAGGLLVSEAQGGQVEKVVRLQKLLDARTLRVRAVVARRIVRRRRPRSNRSANRARRQF